MQIVKIVILFLLKCLKMSQSIYCPGVAVLDFSCWKTPCNSFMIIWDQKLFSLDMGLYDDKSDSGKGF